MPFNHQAFRDLVDKLDILWVAHAMSGATGQYHTITLQRAYNLYQGKRGEPSSAELDVLYSLARKHGLADIDFYQKPELKEATEDRKRKPKLKSKTHTQR
jgi:hypothetical protein